MKSTQPFPETFRAIREMQGLSERQVSKAAARHGAPGHSTLNRIYTGENQPFPHHMQAIAAALGIDPDTFAEFRLFKVARLFDIVGDERRQLEPIPFERAMRNLARWEELTGSAEDDQPDSPLDPAAVAASISPRAAHRARGERS